MGSFAGKLAQLSLKKNENCECGKEETAEHVLLECPLWNDELETPKQRVVEEEKLSPPTKAVLLQPNVLEYLNIYAKTVCKLK
ncbi:hypothetical protein ILUMI_19166 [Ignelater luminosus]|uniref:Reverse transcriptase n=1 Tax=Ignelater luminosus TaxID=2038154 RepID=A0A8K0G3G5_IGNLU|nr:hypothetical protein ILUMI_19166 [Ignelater luminosus]